MRILLDEQLPRQLVQYFKGHDARTVKQQGWAGRKNGALLKHAATAGFEVFITSDQNIEFQQNLKKGDLFVVVLQAWPPHPHRRLKRYYAAGSFAIAMRGCQRTHHNENYRRL